MTWTPTNGRKPKTGERRLKVMWRNGEESNWDYVAANLRWTHTGDSHDIVAVRRV